jgi:3-oxoacyl-[acyl-carrier-protein] synthase II
MISRVERIAVTGLGIVTSLGSHIDQLFPRLIAGESGVLPLTDALGIAVGGPPVAAVREPSWLDAPAVAALRCDRLAHVAVRQAVESAHLDGAPLGLLLGETTGASREAVIDYCAVDPEDISPLLRHLGREPLGVTGERLRLSFPQIVSSTVVCSACSSGAVAIALGALRLQRGAATAQLVGGVDAISALTLIGFGSLGALSDKACRPFDANRNGLNLGEGAAFLVLETESMARHRQARILGWLDGFAIGAEAHHLTHPETDGTRASELIRAAMERAGFAVGDVGYINAHGTATLPNDSMESLAISRVFGEAVPRVRVSSSKGQLGHTLGAAGAVEATIVVEALRRQYLVPTVGLARVDPACELAHVLEKGEPSAFSAALSTSFGFGGSGAVLAFSSSQREDGRPNTPPSPGGVFVTDVISLSSAGILRGAENAQLVDASAAYPPPQPQLPFEPLDLLVMERSRRFDRVTAMAALAADSLLASKVADGATTGLVLGNALGDVTRTVEFLKRVRKRGLKGAHPAEFPHTLPSSISGNASIYAGLKGPVLNVSEFGETAELALEVALDCLDGSLAESMITGSAEALDPVLLAEVDGDLANGALPWTEGAAFMLLASARVRSSAGRNCRLHWFGPRDATSPDKLRLPKEIRGEIITSGDDALLSATWLAESGWDRVSVRALGARVGRGWHLSAFVHAVAAARVLSGDADAVLAVTVAPQGVHIAHFVCD